MESKHKAGLKSLVRGVYDVQKLRIMAGNRLVGNFKAKLGQKPSMPEEEMDAKGKKILKDLRAQYRKITDGVAVFPSKRKFTGEGLITEYTELCLIAQYLDLESHEQQHFRRLEPNLADFPIWTQWLKGVKGCGPAMAGVIISEIDIHKARYVSSLWKFAGLDVASDGQGRSRKAAHLVKMSYTNAKGEQAERNSITFNPFLRTKSLGVLGPSFLRSGSAYAKIYYDYKQRLENRDDWKEKTKLHRHNASIRYMIKMFYLDLYKVWRKLEGLPVAAPYHEAKLGIFHGTARTGTDG